MNQPTEFTLGKYKVLSLVARGGMAEVYKAYQPGLDRNVAIKVIHPHLAGEATFIRRFEREAASVARLRHPNIVQVIDFDCQDERYYLVMEFIEGDSLLDELETRSKQGKIYSPQEAAYLVSAVASALDYAHNRGVVHRDIKPGNILFTGEAQVVLTDFGIAHIVGTTQYTENDSALGTPAYISPEQACGSPGDARGDIYSLGVVLYQLLLGRLPFEADTALGLIQQHIRAEPPRPREIDPDLSKTVENVVLKALAKDPQHRYQHAGEMALELLKAVGLSAEEVIGVGGLQSIYTTPVEFESANRPLPSCPYRGLFAFREEDAPFFFGREDFTDQLIEAMEDRSFVAVLGSSGSGKSSVVFAGLLPHLRQASGLRGAQGYAWMIAECRPGVDPFYSLATALIPLLERALSETDYLLEARKLASAMENGDLPMADVFHRILVQNPEYGRFLLVIDQFEELYTLCPSTAVQLGFVQALLEAIETGSNLSLLVTLRADFLGQALSNRPLADALQHADLKLGPMGKWELVQAVESPARKLGVTFEPGLVERILDDIGEEPGNLALLEFALTQLWEEQAVGQLSHATYEAIGRVQGALSRYADRIYADFDETKREQSRHIFTQMVRPGEGTVDTRRLAFREELGEEDWALVQELADARLVVTGQEVARGQETVEVVHEALIHSWGQLRDWMEEDRTFRSWQERLRSALYAWEASDHDEGALLRGAPLIEAQRWFSEREDFLGVQEIAFIQVSLTLRDTELAAIERRRRISIIALSAGMVIAIILALIAFQQRQDALTQARIAFGRELTLAAQNNLAVDPQLSILLGLQSASIWETLDRPLPSDLQYILHQAIQASRVRVTWPSGEVDILSVGFLQPGDLPRVVTADPQTRSIAIWDPVANQKIASIQGVDFASFLNPDGSLIAAPGKENAVDLFDIRSGQVLISLSGHRASMRAAAFSPDGKYLLSKSGSEYILWEILPGRKILEIPTPAGGDIRIPGTAFSSDGKHFAVINKEKGISIFEISTGQQILAIQTDFDIIATAFSPDGKYLAGAGRVAYAQIWDTTSGKVVNTLDMSQAPTAINPQAESLAYSPDGNRLALEGGIWDLFTGQVLINLLGHKQSLTAQAFNSDGTQLITASYDGTVKIWDLTPEHEIFTFSHPSGGFLWGIAISPDGNKLVTAGEDMTAIVWDTLSGKRIITLRGHTGAVNGANFSTDGTLLATVSADRKVIIWDTRSWQIRHILIGHTEDIWPIQVLGGILDIAFSPDCDSQIGEQKSCPLASVGFDGQLIVWDAYAGQILYTYLDPVGGLKSVAFSPDGNLIAIGTTGEIAEPIGSITILNASSGQVLLTLSDKQQSGWVWDLAFNPTNGHLASVTFSGDGIVWDATSGEPQYSLKGQGSGASVAVNPAGTLLATGDGGGNINLWESGSGLPLLSLPGHASLPVTGLEFSPDGKYLASASVDGTARLFVVPPEELLSLARSRLTRDWSPEECQQYLHTEICPSPLIYSE